MRKTAKEKGCIKKKLKKFPSGYSRALFVCNTAAKRQEKKGRDPRNNHPQPFQRWRNLQNLLSRHAEKNAHIEHF